MSSKSRARRKKRVSILTLNKIEVVDYKDTALLRKFINDRGKMLSSRQTGTTAKQQRQVAIAVKRAREMALLPFVVTEMN
ncbi:MAG TPA: 30S ribosomal protein S18, partial [Fimbriimonas sp.]|nr:30S ribosomal protein S18 [Fimbriimonas sp.]